MKDKIDLHIHTTFSDGVYSPKQIIDMAIKNGVSTISIADHDTIEAYTLDFFDYAIKNGVNLIPAVEMSTKYDGIGIHVLGYNIDLKNKELIQTLNLLKNARKEYLINVSKKLNELGYKLNMDKLKEFPSVTKAHIALDIVGNVENKNILIKEFGHIPSKGEFIEAIMNEGCIAYVEKYSITPKKASEIIKKAGGKVILAHPVAYVHIDNLKVEKIDELVKEMNADGIEANYMYINRNNELINESLFWNKYAIENNLMVTAGSDFHTIDGIHPTIGFSNYDFEPINVNLNDLLKEK